MPDRRRVAPRYQQVHFTGTTSAGGRGELEVDGQRMADGDGARVRDARSLTFARGRGAEVLVFDLRPNELPSM